MKFRSELYLVRCVGYCRETCCAYILTLKLCVDSVFETICIIFGRHFVCLESVSQESDENMRMPVVHVLNMSRYHGISE